MNARIVVLVVCVFSILGVGFFMVQSAAAAPNPENSTTTTDTTTTTTTEESTNNQTAHTIGHVTIHEVRWHPDRVEIDYTAGRGDTIKITDFEGDRFFWENYRVDAGTGTITHKFEGDSGRVSFSVKSEKEGKTLQEATRFVMPGANEVATLLLGVMTVFLLLGAIKLRRDRKREQGAKQVF